jgi:hypothetical protein
MGPAVPSTPLAPAGPTADSPATDRQASGPIRTATIRSRRPVRLASGCLLVCGLPAWPAAAPFANGPRSPLPTQRMERAARRSPVFADSSELRGFRHARCLPRKPLIRTGCSGPCDRERTTAAPRVIPLACRAHGASVRENSLARIWHSYLIFATFRRKKPEMHSGFSSVLAGHRPTRVTPRPGPSPRSLLRRC